MIGYVTPGTNKIEQAAHFYDELFAMLGAKRAMQNERFIAWGTSPEAPMVCIIKPFDGKAATPGNGNMTAICAWPDGATATLELTVDAHYGFRALALGKEGFHCAAIDISDCYREGMKRILPCLRGESDGGVPVAQMIEAVQVGKAIDRSLGENRRIYLKDL